MQGPGLHKASIYAMIAANYKIKGDFIHVRTFEVE